MIGAPLICADPHWLMKTGDAILFQAHKKFRLLVLGKFMSHDPSLGLASPLVYKSYKYGVETQDGVSIDPVDGQKILDRVIAIFNEEISNFNDVLVWRALPDDNGEYFRCAFTMFSLLNPRPYKPSEY